MQSSQPIKAVAKRLKGNVYENIVLSLCVLYRGFTIPNRGCSPNDLYSEAYTEVYTEVKELDHTNNKEAPQKQNENQNPLYETIGAEAVCNPIYDRFATLLLPHYLWRYGGLVVSALDFRSEG